MLLIFGLDTKQRSLGPGQVRMCPRCHNTTQWNRLRSYRQLTVFFVLPVARWRRRRFEVCGICGAGVDV